MFRVGPHRFDLATTVGGPVLAVAGPGPHAAVADLVNHAVGPDGPAIRAALEADRSWSDYPLAVEVPIHEGDAEEMRTSWREQGGAPTEGPMLRLVTAGGLAGIPRAEYLAAVDALAAMRASFVPPEGPWLFRPDPINSVPHPEDLRIARSLDERARAVDAGVPVEGFEPDETLAARRALLADCEAAGLFSERYADARTRALDFWGCTTLAAWHRAAQELRAWLDDPRRLARYAAVPRLLDAPVTVDAIRLYAPTRERAEWLLAGEALVPDTAEEDQGTTFRRGAEGWVTLRWRRDGARPALLAWGRGAR